MKRILFISFLVFSSGLFASPLRVGEVYFLPSGSYVGDPVEMKVPLLETPSNFAFNWEGDEESLSPFLEIRDVTYDERSSTLTVHFVSYSVGRQTLPVIKVGDGFTLEGLGATTLTLAEEGARTLPLKKPLLVAGTEILFFLVIASLLILPIALIQGGRATKDWISRQRQRYLFRRPYGQFRDEMEDLYRHLSEPSAYHFFSRLDQVLRVFLSHRLGENFSSYTTKEMRVFLRDKNIFSFQESETLIDLFRMSDLVKFADYQIDQSTREVFWRDIMTLCEKFEQERREHVNL